MCDLEIALILPKNVGCKTIILNYIKLHGTYGLPLAVGRLINSEKKNTSVSFHFISYNILGRSAWMRIFTMHPKYVNLWWIIKWLFVSHMMWLYMADLPIFIHSFSFNGVRPFIGLLGRCNFLFVYRTV